MNVCSDSLLMLLSIMCCFGSNIIDIRSSSSRSHHEYAGVLAESVRVYTPEVYAHAVRSDPCKLTFETIFFITRNILFVCLMD